MAMSHDEWVWNPYAPPEQQTLLARFVLEGRPEIARIVADAEELLEAATGDPSFDAYVSSDPDRVRAQCRAIYESIRKRRLTYRVEPPKSLTTRQVVRPANEVLDNRHGCCLDLVLLLAAALKHVGIFPVITVVDDEAEPDHALLGYWTSEMCLTDREGLPLPVLTWNSLQKELKNLEFVECTDMTEAPSFDYAKAQQDALTYLPPNPGRGVRYAVDVEACRRIIPEPVGRHDSDGHHPTKREEQQYPDHLRNHILQSEPQWAPQLYAPLGADEVYRPDPAIFQLLRPRREGTGTLGKETTIADIVDELKRQTHPIVVTGEAGSGKSVVIRQFVLHLLSEAGTDRRLDRIPILVDLRYFGGPTDVVSFARQYLTKRMPFASVIGEAIEELLLSGRVVLLFDGLDEMPRKNYANRLAKLKALTGAYPNNRFVFTCRSPDYDPALRFHHFALQPLTDNGIQDFLSKSFHTTSYPEALGPESLRKTAPWLLERCRNPLRLRMLVTYFISKGGVPKNATEMDETFVMYLLNRRIGAHTRASLQDVMNCLAELALCIADNEGVGVEMKKANLDSKVWNEVRHRDALTVGIESGVLCENPEKDSLSFSHHRLQEYFAALALAKRYEATRDPKSIEPYIADVWSQEIVRTLVTLLGDPGALIVYIARPAGDPQRLRLFLAASCVSRAGNRVPKNVVDRIAQGLATTLSHSNPAVRVGAITALATIDPASAARLLPECLDDSSPWVRETAATVLATTNLSESLFLPGVHGKGRKLLYQGQAWWRIVQSPEGTRPYEAVFGTIVYLALAFVAVSVVVGADFQPVLQPVMYTAFYYLVIRLYYDEALYSLRFINKGGRWLHVLLRAAPGVAFAALALMWSLFAFGSLPTLVMTVIAFISLSVADKYVFNRARNDVVGIAVATFAQMILPVLFGSVAVRLGLFRDSMRSGIVLQSLAGQYVTLWLYLCISIAAFLALVTHYVRRSESRPEAVAMLRAIATTEHPSHIRLIVSVVNSLYRRRAILALGHLPYSEATMDALLEVAERDPSALLRDSAAQAIAEVQNRQRRERSPEGLDVSPHSYRMGKDAGEEIRGVWLLGTGGTVMAVIATLYLIGGF